MKYRKNLFQSFVFLLMIIMITQAPIRASSNCKETEPEKPLQLSNTYQHRYIIELTAPVESDRMISNTLSSPETVRDIILNQQQRLLNQWKVKAYPINLISQLFTISNAMIVETSYVETFEQIRQYPEVKGIYCVNEYYLQRNISIPSIMAPEVWSKLDKNGKFIEGNQIRIGVIDTGIEYWHGDLGGGIGKKPDGSFYKVISGYDFAEMNEIPYDPGISFHGTHVSGIIAGYGQAGIASGETIGKGVAPQASLISYKVFTNNRKSTGSDSVLLALDQAVRDKCDVVNLSLGRFFGWSDDFLSLACQKASDLGIIVVASAGNDGEKDINYNIFPINAPSSGKDVLSVGSIDETVKFGFTFEYKNKLYKYPGRLFQNSPSFSTDPVPVCFFNNEGDESNYKDTDVTGKIIFVKRGGKTFAEKNAIAKQFGAAGLVVYNYSKGWFYGFLNSDTDNIPSMSISQEAGEAIQSILKEAPDLKIQFKTSFTCTVISDFSSEGPTPDCIFKPDLCAPGTSILSAALNGGYSYASGTSMSAPHVSGASALLRQAYPDYSISDIRSLLINYSEVIFNPYTQKPYSWLKQGAGKLNVLKSYEGFITLSPSTLVLPIENLELCESDTSILLQCSNKRNESIQIKWKVEGSFQGKEISLSLSRDSIDLEPMSSDKFLTDIIIPDELFADKKGDPWLEFNLIGFVNHQPLFHVPGLYPVLPLPELDPNPVSFCFPTLAISPNYDGNSDSNYFYFLSSYITNGYQVDIWDDEMKKRIGVLDYGQYENSAGYFQVPITGDVQGITLDDNFYTIVPYLLKKNDNPEKQESWIRGKTAKLLIDRINPTLSVDLVYNPVTNEMKATGKLSDNHQEFGLFLMYELDYDVADLIDVNPDGTFSFTLQTESEYGFIAFTAQDIAGNIYRIKKRLH